MERFSNTSTGLIETEVRRFLESDEAEILSITGEWGVGKTFLWNQLLEEVVQEGKFGKKKYSYVSLFGLNSLESLKLTIFENTIDLESSKNNSAYPSWLAPKNWRKLLSKSTDISIAAPRIGKAMEKISQFYFLNVFDQIICIDDLERKSAGLAVTEVFGLASFLREQRKCKTVFLLNENKLGDAKGDYNDNFEKVIEISLSFEPTSEEATRIGLPDNSEIRDAIQSDCISLNIRNIRIIRKILRLAKQMEYILTDYNIKTLRHAIHTLVLGAWSKYQPDTAPSREFIQERGIYKAKQNNDELTSKEASWTILLDNYQFSHVDEFDEVIFEGIDRGFFDPEKLKSEADKIETLNDRSEAAQALSEAWSLFHFSFEENQDKFVKELSETFKKHILAASPTDLDSVVCVLKDLEEEDLAAELLQLYMSEKKDSPEGLWDLAKSPFGRHVTDTDVRKAFSRKLQSIKRQPSLFEILSNIGERHVWAEEDLIYISDLPVSEYKKVFKQHTEKDLNKALDGALFFGNIANANDVQRRIVANARDALTEIGRESPINASRVKRFGIKVNKSQ